MDYNKEVKLCKDIHDIAGYLKRIAISLEKIAENTKQDNSEVLFASYIEDDLK